MDTSRKCEREHSEEDSKKKGKKPIEKNIKPKKVEREPTKQDLRKGKKPIQESVHLGKANIYDDLMEDTSETAMSAEKEKIDAESALQEFLYEAKALHDYITFFHMFNREFDLSVILDHHSDFLEEYLTEFKKLTALREVEYQGVNYIHAIDLVQDKISETARLNKKFITLLEGAKLAITKCPKCKHKCRLFQTHAGFLVFFYLRARQRKESDSESMKGDLEDPLSPQSAFDPEEEFDLQKEKEMAKDLSLSKIRSIPTSVSAPASSQRSTSLPLPLLPTYPPSGG